MAVFKNITAEGVTTIVSKNQYQNKGDVVFDTINISNNSPTNSVTISLQLWDGDSTGYNIIGNVRIPAGTALMLNDGLKFNNRIYNLRTETTGTSPIVDIIIS